MYTTSDVMILNAIVEWAKWEELEKRKPARHCRRNSQV